MNTHFKDEMLRVISDEIDTPTVDAQRRTGRPILAPAMAVAASAAVIAGMGVLAWPGADGGTNVSIRPDGTGRAADAPAGAGASSTPDAPPDIPDRPFALPAGFGKVWRTSPSASSTGTQAPVLPGSIEILGYRRADSDPRVSGVTISPLGRNSIIGQSEAVERIGDRDVVRPEGLVYPEGVDESNSTGPFMWTEADGTQWTANATLDELRRSLPLVHYVDSTMQLGEGLVPWNPNSSWPVEVQGTRNERWELTVYRDTDSQFEVADPVKGLNRLVTVQGRPAAIRADGAVTWRVDPETVLVVRNIPGTNLDGSGMSFAMPTDELLAVAEGVHETTSGEYAELPLWRGAAVERVIVRVAGAPDTMAMIGVADSNGQSRASYSVAGNSAGGHGLALALSKEDIGRELTLSLFTPTRGVTLADGTVDDNGFSIDTSGIGDCPVTVTVPDDGEPPVEVTLTADC